MSLGADGKDHVKTLPAFLKEALQLLRGILQIGVEDGDHVAAGMFQASRQCGLMTKMPRQGYDFETRLAVGYVFGDGERVIGAAVVNEDDFEVLVPGRGTPHNAHVKNANAVAFVECGNDEGDHGARVYRRRPSASNANKPRAIRTSVVTGPADTLTMAAKVPCIHGGVLYNR